MGESAGCGRGGVLPTPERGFFSVGVTQAVIPTEGAGVSEHRLLLPLRLALGTRRSEARGQGSCPLLGCRVFNHVLPEAGFCLFLGRPPPSPAWGRWANSSGPPPPPLIAEAGKWYFQVRGGHTAASRADPGRPSLWLLTKCWAQPSQSMWSRSPTVGVCSLAGQYSHCSEGRTETF